MRIRTLGAVFALAVVAACSSKDLNITNPNVTTVEGAAADPNAIQLLATGLLVDLRGLTTGPTTGLGILGREAYNFTPTEGRNTTYWIVGINVAGTQKVDPAGGATGFWGTGFNTRRDIFNYYAAVEGSTTLTAAQKSAAKGFAQTIEAFGQLQVITTRDTLGAPTEIREIATDLAPFVTRDSNYKWILNTLDAGYTNLQAGGAAFPFTLHAGFVGSGTTVFNTPAGFAKFNRALRARAGSYYAGNGGGAAQWAGVATALGQSFLDASATTQTARDLGVYQIFSTATGDATNGLSQAVNTNLYAHASFTTDAQLKADGTPDARYTAKIRTGLPSRTGPLTADGPTSAASTIGFSIWPTNLTPYPTIRNEELMLLNAEAKWWTGDKAGAITALNSVRTNSGGLPASTLTAASTDDAFITAILYERRFSLMMESQRWLDHKRYGKLGTLPLDIATGGNKNFVAKVLPIPQAECLVRALSTTKDVLGPNGTNSCAP